MSGRHTRDGEAEDGRDQGRGRAGQAEGDAGMSGPEGVGESRLVTQERREVLQRIPLLSVPVRGVGIKTKAARAAGRQERRQEARTPAPSS